MHYCILQLLQVLIAKFHNSVLMYKTIIAKKKKAKLTFKHKMQNIKGY